MILHSEITANKALVRVQTPLRFACVARLCHHTYQGRLVNCFLYLFVIIIFSFKVSATESIVNGNLASVKSSILNEKRDYYVYLPPSYISSKSNFPVLYVLDGDVHRWKAITGILEALSTETLENQVQEAIVVAIPNTNRDRDLTPTTLPNWTFEGKILETFKSSGGSAQYLRFIKEELMPHIESQYRTTNKRILVGESFAGLFGAYVLLYQPETFTGYLIIDPTSLWDNDYLNRTYKKVEFNKREPKAEIYFAFANNSNLGNIGLTNQLWGQSFASRLEAQSTGTFHVKKEYFKNESHGTVAFLGWYNGLKYLLPNSSN